MEEIAFVYWIFDETCSDRLTDGYIGVTRDVKTRFRAHLKHKRVPHDSQITVIFTGPRDECFSLENSLRPEKNIGWNNAPGGARGNRLGFTHSSETKARMRAAWTDVRRADHAKRLVVQNKKLRGQKRPKQSVSVSGDKNGMYGNKHSEESKQKMSLNMKGRIPHNKSNTKCPICDTDASPSIIKKYHGLGKTNCKSK
jgi:predicted GIY-YIG superfamily endonuclease